jgi:predicted membrane channel-forming protein YqfA (hemolysin III family)
MPRRLRTLVGTIAILVFVCVYALMAIAIADSRIVNAPNLVQTLVYFLLGTIWILPLLPLIRWMEGGRR